MSPRKSTRGNPPPPLTQDTVNWMIQESVEAVIRAEREFKMKQIVLEDLTLLQLLRNVLFADFMECIPITFRGNEGAVGLIRWIEKSEMVFTVSKCTEANKVVFAAATFQDRALTWWNSQVVTLGIEAVTRKTVKDMDISSYTTRFNELMILCPGMVPTERKKVEAYTRGLSENIKGEVTASEPATLNKAVRMVYTLMEQKVKAIAEREADNKKRKCGMQHYGNYPIKCNKCGKIGHKARDCWSKVVATLGIEAVTRKTWAEMKVIMTEEFYPPEEIQRMESTLNKVVRMAQTLMEQKVKATAEREADNKKRK
nr:hypothetical protein [Tanacetum cinerariifolium]